MLNGESIIKETSFNLPLKANDLLESHQNFTVYEKCPKCGGYRWIIGAPKETGSFMCFCPIDVELPMGWVCPVCKKVLSPEIKFHACCDMAD